MSVDRPTGRRPDWPIVCGQELRDLWVSGPGPLLAVAFSALLGIIAYLAATNRALNFLEQRESIGLTLQVAVAVGALLVLLASADAISGSRERGTLESLLVTPVSRTGLAFGKLVAALSLWWVAFAIAIPFVWFLGRGIGVVGTALVVGLVVGTLEALFLGAFALVVSIFARSNRVALGSCLFTLLALFAPTMLPTGAGKGWFGTFLEKINPLAAGGHFVGRLVVDGHSVDAERIWLVSPVVGAVVGLIAVAYASRAIALRGGSGP